jgi:hypothetical protein
MPLAITLTHSSGNRYFRFLTTIKVLISCKESPTIARRHLHGFILHSGYPSAHGHAEKVPETAVSIDYLYGRMVSLIVFFFLLHAMKTVVGSASALC